MNLRTLRKNVGNFIGRSNKLPLLPSGARAFVDASNPKSRRKAVRRERPMRMSWSHRLYVARKQGGSVPGFPPKKVRAVKP